MKPRKTLAELSGWVFAFTGAVFSLLSFYSPAFDWVNALLITDATTADTTAKLYAHVMGSVMVGFGTTIALISRSIKSHPKDIATAMLIGAWSWFIVDTTGSLLHGSWQNGIFNLVGWVLLIPPILILKKSL